MFQLNDMILELDDKAGIRITSDGYMAAMPRVARTGIQLYRGAELGIKDKDIVRIYRPPEEVFKADALKSFVGKPFTDNHPKTPVNATNWKDVSRGITGEDVLRDGEYVRVPMVLMDGTLIKRVQGGKTQLSAGYTCDIAWGEGRTPAGEVYDGTQTDIRINHVAVVDHARGGQSLSIGDAAKISDAVVIGVKAIRAGEVNDLDPLDAGAGVTCLLDTSYPFIKNGKVYTRALRDARTTALAAGDTSGLLAVDMLLELIGNHGQQKDSRTMKTLVVDGITCEMSDTAVEVVQRALKTATDAFNFEKKKATEEEEKKKKVEKDSGEQIAKLTTELSTRDAKITTLETQLKDAAMTPDKLDGLVKDRQQVADKAKALLPTVVVDGKSVDDIRAQVVTAKLGDLAKGWNEGQIKTSFDTLTAGVITKDNAGLLDTARAFSSPPSQMTLDS
ncbi:MAG TPA: DUF2213 domain-containing protein, partial [Vicinamibacterales bacterium]|nr:DUF2213 domain-containing protein [Vicinamibacterales bacterium]